MYKIDKNMIDKIREEKIKLENKELELYIKGLIIGIQVRLNKFLYSIKDEVNEDAIKSLLNKVTRIKLEYTYVEEIDEIVGIEDVRMYVGDKGEYISISKYKVKYEYLYVLIMGYMNEEYESLIKYGISSFENIRCITLGDYMVL